MSKNYEAPHFATFSTVPLLRLCFDSTDYKHKKKQKDSDTYTDITMPNLLRQGDVHIAFNCGIPVCNVYCYFFTSVYFKTAFNVYSG
jgi:hypothetical protein